MWRERRSYAEVLAKMSPLLDEPFGAFLGPMARVPKWVSERSEGAGQADKSGQILVLSKCIFIDPAKNAHAPI